VTAIARVWIGWWMKESSQRRVKTQNHNDRKKDRVALGEGTLIDIRCGRAPVCVCVCVCVCVGGWVGVFGKESDGTRNGGRQEKPEKERQKEEGLTCVALSRSSHSFTLSWSD
jgi:hypothetical protein